MKINRFFYKQFDFYFGLLFALWFGGYDLINDVDARNPVGIAIDGLFLVIGLYYLWKTFFARQKS